MKARRRMSPIMILGLLFAGFIALAFLPAAAMAQDADQDGYLDWEEETGRLTPLEMTQDFPVNPTMPDAFVILKPASGSLFPSDPSDCWHEPMTRLQNKGGLGLNVNVITETSDTLANPDRFITSRQKAGKITEDTFNAVGDVLGWCQQGTFNDEDNCIIFTARIVNHIKKVCGSRYGSPSCKDNAGNFGDALVSSYVTWAMVHELGHSMTIERCYIEENGGNHSPAGSGYIMDQSVVAVDKKGIVTFTIPKVYSPESQSAYDLAFEKDSSVCEVITTSKKK